MSRLYNALSERLGSTDNLSVYKDSRFLYRPVAPKEDSSIGSFFDGVKAGAMSVAAPLLDKADSNTYLGSFANATRKGGVGTYGGIADFAHADDTAKGLNDYAASMDDPDAVEPGLNWNYITSPHGLTRSVGEAVGSTLALAPAMAVAPESAVGAGVGLLARLGGDAVVKGLVRHGMYTAAKQAASKAPFAVRYAMTSPFEAASEGGNTRREILDSGGSERDATLASAGTFAANIPLLTLSNLGEGALLGGAAKIPAKAGAGFFRRAVTAPFRAAPTAALEGLQNGIEEVYQDAISSAMTGKDYGILPWNYTDEQKRAFGEGFAGGVGLGAASGTFHAMSPRYGIGASEEEKAYKQGAPKEQTYDTRALIEAGLKRRAEEEQAKQEEASAPRVSLVDAAAPFMGKRMDNGSNGCVEAVTKIGAACDSFLADQLNKGVVYVPTLIKNAGDRFIPFDADKLEEGDVIVYGGDEHVVLYDGKGGYIGNSSSQQKVVHGSDYNQMGDLKPTGIIKANDHAGSGRAHVNAPQMPDYTGLIADADTIKETENKLRAIVEGDRLTPEQHTAILEAAQMIRDMPLGSADKTEEATEYSAWQKLIDTKDAKGIFEKAPEKVAHIVHKLGMEQRAHRAPKQPEMKQAQTPHIENMMKQSPARGTAPITNGGISDGALSSAQNAAGTGLFTGNLRNNFPPVLTAAALGSQPQQFDNVVKDVPQRAQTQEGASMPPVSREEIAGIMNRVSEWDARLAAKNPAYAMARNRQDWAAAGVLAQQAGEKGLAQFYNGVLREHSARNARDITPFVTVGSPAQNNAPVQTAAHTAPQMPQEAAVNLGTTAPAGYVRPSVPATLPKAVGKRRDIGRKLLKHMKKNDISVAPMLFDDLIDGKAKAIRAAQEKIDAWEKKNGIGVSPAAENAPQSAETGAHDKGVTPKKNLAQELYGDAEERAGEESENGAHTDGEVAPGYRTESGRPLSEADKREFIVHNDGRRDLGAISEYIENATNGAVKAAPIRLQVGDADFGYIHLLKHAPQMKQKGYGVMDYINHILKNFNQIYSQQSQNRPHRFALYYKDDSKGFMPIDLELEQQGDGYYTIVSVMPHNPKIKGTLLFDGSANPPSTTTDGALLEETDKTGGVGTSPNTHGKSNVLSDSSVSQEEEKDKGKEAHKKSAQMSDAKSPNLNARSDSMPTDDARVSQDVQENKGAKSAQKQGEPLRGRTGKETTITTDSGKEIKAHYRLVPAKEVVTSHTVDGASVNPAYPAELQPRDRGRVSMRLQVESMARNLRPADLASGRNLNQGAPVMRADGVILNGNGRANAIRMAQESVPNAATMYKKYLVQNAREFGFSPDDVARLHKPMLVRVVDGDVSAQLIEDIIGSTAGGSALSASEQAEADAKKIKPGTLDLYVPNETGDFTAATNSDFVAAVLRDIAGKNDFNALTDRDGNVSADGISRVKRAVFSLAYGDDGLVAKMAESTDDNIRNVSRGLISAAPGLARLNANAKKGAAHDYPLSAAISSAAKTLEMLRTRGQSVENYLSNESLFSEHEESASTKVILEFFDRNKRSGKRITEFLQNAVKGIEGEGNPDQMSMFDVEELSLEEILHSAAESAEGKHGAGEVPEGLSTDGARVYRDLAQLLEEFGGKTKRAARMAALLFARHADMYAKAYAKHTGKPYTAMDYYNKKFGLDTAGEFGNGDGLFQAMMPDIDLDEKVPVLDITNALPSGEAAGNKQVLSFLRQEIKKGNKITSADGKAVISMLPKDARHITFSSRKTIIKKDQSTRKGAIYSLSDLLKQAVLVESIPNEKKEKKPNVRAYHRFYVPVKTRDGVSTIRIVAEEQNGVITLNPTDVNVYDIIVENRKNTVPPTGLKPVIVPHGVPSKEETRGLAGISPVIDPHGFSSTVTIRDMLRGVKDYDGNPYINPDGTGNFYQAAWHGSPYEFASFDLGKIGSGEGAQAHGWGLYFAKNRKISEEYKNRLNAKVTFSYDGKSLQEQPKEIRRQLKEILDIAQKFAFNARRAMTAEDLKAAHANLSKTEKESKADLRKSYQRELKGLEKSIEWIENHPESRGFDVIDKVRFYMPMKAVAAIDSKGRYRAIDAKAELLRLKEETEKELETGLARLDMIYGYGAIKQGKLSVSTAASRLYQVDIPEDGVLLDEQKSFDEQPTKVQKALDKALRKLTLDELENWGDVRRVGREKIIAEIKDSFADTDGSRIYGTIVDLVGSPKEASLILNAAGIKGITYDGRRDGRCYVVFDDKAVSIIETYNQEHRKEIQGRISALSDGKRIISLFESADESTFLHEMGHMFLMDLRELAKISKDAARDVAAVEKWAAWNEGAAEEYKGTPWAEEFAAREKKILAAEEKGDKDAADRLKEEWTQERFARGFERYLHDGKAPNSMLARVFEQLKKLLTDVYHAFKGDGGKPSEEVRRVMDRLLGAEEERNKKGGLPVYPAQASENGDGIPAMRQSSVNSSVTEGAADVNSLPQNPVTYNQLMADRWQGDTPLERVLSRDPKLEKMAIDFGAQKKDGKVSFANEAKEEKFLKIARALQDVLLNKFSINSWQGSPHDFDAISFDFIGSGEGFQAHGHGGYSAEQRSVAEGYRDRWQGGKLYHLEIPDADVMLDEQKDYAEQSKKVQKAIDRLLNGLTDEQLNDWDDVSFYGRDKVLSDMKSELYGGDGEHIYRTVSAILGGDKYASELFNKYGIKGITYDGQQDGRCYVVFDEKNMKIIEKFSAQRRKAIEKMLSEMRLIDDDKLLKKHRAIADMGEELGVPVVFFKGNKDLHGFHDPRSGVTFLNVDSDVSPRWVFWHETLHWMKANNPGLYRDLVQAIEGREGFTKKQLDAYREKIGAFDMSDADVIEEMIADALPDVKGRVAFLRDVGKANTNIVERFVAWIHDVMRRFHEHLKKAGAGLTYEQRGAMVTAFGNLVGSLRDGDGHLIFRVQNEGARILLRDGSLLPAVKYSASDTSRVEAQERLEGDVKRWEALCDRYASADKSQWKKNHDGDLYDFMDMPVVLEMISNNNMQLQVYGSFFQHALRSVHKGMTMAIVKQLPAAMADPVMILRGNNARYVFVLDLKDSNGATILVPVEIQKTDARHGVVNIVNTAYGKTKKDGITPNTSWFENQILRGNLLYLNKKKALTGAGPAGLGLNLQSPNGNPALLSALSHPSIKTDADLVKEKSKNPLRYSISLDDDDLKFSVTGNFRHLMNRIKEGPTAEDNLEIDGMNAPRKTLSQNVSPRLMWKFKMDKHLTEKDIVSREPLPNGDIRVTYYAHNANDIGYIDKMKSVRQVALRNPFVEVLYNLAKKAMHIQEHLRNEYGKSMKTVGELLKKQEDRETAAAILWQGDSEGKAYNDTELRSMGASDNVVKAYKLIREELGKAYRQLNDARMQVRTRTKRMSPSEVETFKKTHWIKDGDVLSTVPVEGNKVLLTWRGGKTYETEGRIVSAEELAGLQSDENIIVTGARKLNAKQHGTGMYSVDYVERIRPIHNLTGYMPHFFHEWMLYEVYKDTDGKTRYASVGSGRTMNEAVRIGNQFAAANRDKKYVLRAKGFDMGAENTVVIGDMDFAEMSKKLAESTEMSLDEAREFLQNKAGASLKSRHRHFGNMMHRKGAEGFDKNIFWVLGHYFNSTARYIGMEQFKPDAISMYERAFGSFNAETKNRTAQFCKNLINDVNGNPRGVEEWLNDLIKDTWIGKRVSDTYGDRAALAINGELSTWNAITKLGLGNFASAAVNFSQFINIGAALNSYAYAKKGLMRALHPDALDEKIIEASGLLDDINLAADNGGYSQRRGGYAGTVYAKAKKFGEWTLIPFQKADTLMRKAAVLGAYYQGIEKLGMKKAPGDELSAQALAYAQDTNDAANFDYSAANAPEAFRAGSVVTQQLFQFMKYPIMQFEFMYNILRHGTRGQKVRMFVPYVIFCGLGGSIPFGDLFNSLFSFLFGLATGDKDKDIAQDVKAEVLRWAEKDPVKKAIAETALYGVLAPTFGLDISGRIGMNSAFSGQFYGEKPDSTAGVVANMLGGPALNSAVNMLNQAHEGNPIEALKAVSPALGNMAQAWAGESRTTRHRVNSRYDTTYDKIAHALGFRTTEESNKAFIMHYEYGRKDKAKRDKQDAIRAYIDDPSPENRRVINALGIKDKQIEDARVQMNRTAIERATKGRPNTSGNRSTRRKEERKEESLYDVLDDED